MLLSKLEFQGDLLHSSLLSFNAFLASWKPPGAAFHRTAFKATILLSCLSWILLCQFFDSKGKITHGIRKVWYLKLEDSGTISNWPLAFHRGWQNRNISFRHMTFEHVSSLLWISFSLSVNGSLGKRVEVIHRSSPPWFALLKSFVFSKHWKRSPRPWISWNTSLTLHCPSYLDNWESYAFMPLSKNP